MGRSANVNPPPRAQQASGTIPAILHAKHLRDLPQTKRRSYVAGTDLSAAAVQLGLAFEWYALWAAGQHRHAPRHELRDWFKQVVGQTTDLLHALGHDRPALSDRGSYEMMVNLIVTKPHPGAVTDGPDRERNAQHDMERLACLAAPDLYAAACRDNADESGWDAACNGINKRLKPMLELLRLLAGRGAEHHARRVTRGGKKREVARKDLFVCLAGQYERLFGTLPGAPSATITRAQEASGNRRTTLPKGPALDWFKALLDIINTEANAALPTYQASGMTPNLSTEMLLGELITLTAAARKGRAGDGLAHWIREGAAEWARRPAAVLEMPALDYVPPSLEDFFG